MSEEIAIDKIRTDCGTQMRAVLDQATVAEYAECIDDLPPITVFHDGEQYYNADGFHRLAAHKEAGRKKIACAVKSGSLRDAILWACSANASHGRRRTREDKRRAVETLLRDEEWGQRSDRWIAEQAAVGHPLVSSVRAELSPPKKTSQVEDLPPERRAGKDGKVYPVPEKQVEDLPPDAKKITGGVTFNVDEFADPPADDSWATPDETQEPEEPELVEGMAKDGRPIPARLTPAFDCVKRLRGMVMRIGALKTECEELTQLPVAPYFDHDDTRRSLEQAAIHLKNTTPILPCPRCKGTGKPCEWCKGTGYITRTKEGALSDLDKKWLNQR